MAPERFFGAPASVRSDVYELGVVLYMMLVGRLPWGSEKNVTDRLNPANPRDAGADVSRTLATVILRALSTRPEVRPATAVELARDVAAAAGESSAPSRRTLDVEMQEAPEQARTTTRVLEAISDAPRRPAPQARSRGRLLTMALLTCVLAVGVGFAARAIGRSSAPAPNLMTSEPVTPAPTSCAAGGMPSVAPVVAPAAPHHAPGGGLAHGSGGAASGRRSQPAGGRASRGRGAEALRCSSGGGGRSACARACRQRGRSRSLLRGP